MILRDHIRLADNRGEGKGNGGTEGTEDNLEKGWNIYCYVFQFEF